jgi:hypothetical protein
MFTSRCILQFRKNVASFTSDQKDEAEKIETSCEALHESISNPRILDRCLELLTELREGFKADGFQSDLDIAVLRKIYGVTGEGNRHKTLVDSYSEWLEKWQHPENESLYPTM